MGEHVLAPIDWLNITQWAWPGDLLMWAGVVTAAGVIWQQVAWPGMRAMWAAVIAAPKIADGVGEVVHLIESDVLGKLEDIQVESARHQAQADARDSRLNLHTLTLEDHELRLKKVEAALNSPRINGGATDDH